MPESEPMSQAEWERRAEESARRSAQRRPALSDPNDTPLLPRRPLVWVGVVLFLLALLTVFYIAAIAAVAVR